MKNTHDPAENIMLMIFPISNLTYDYRYHELYRRHKHYLINYIICNKKAGYVHDQTGRQICHNTYNAQITKTHKETFYRLIKHIKGDKYCQHIQADKYNIVLKNAILYAIQSYCQCKKYTRVFFMNTHIRFQSVKQNITQYKMK